MGEESNSVGYAGEVVEDGYEAESHHVVRLGGRRADAAVPVE